MSLADFFKNEKPCIFSEESGKTVILGPVTSESESGSIKITDNAVEDGTIISDHISKDPESVEVKTFLSDANDLMATAANAAKSVSGLTVDTMTVKDKIKRLKNWRDDGEIVTYSGPVFSGIITVGYDIMAKSMVITKVDVTRGSDTGSGVDVSIGLRQIVIAEAMMKNAKLPTAAKSRTKKGQASTKTEKVEVKESSTLYRIENIGF